MNVMIRFCTNKSEQGNLPLKCSNTEGCLSELIQVVWIVAKGGQLVHHVGVPENIW